MGLGYSAYTHVSKKTNWNKRIEDSLGEIGGWTPLNGSPRIFGKKVLTKLLHDYGEWLIGGSNFEHYGKFNHGRLINRWRKQLRDKNKEIL